MTQVIGFVGDIMVDRDENPGIGFDLIRDALHAPDVMSGNCECVFTDDVRYAPSAAVTAHAPAHNASALGPAGFDYVSLANNHVGDCGHEGIWSTTGLLDEQGIAWSGVGPDLDEARKPAILERDGTTYGFHSWASFYPFGYEAREGWPGLNPFRARNHHVDGVPNLWAPGMPPKSFTVPLPEDVERMHADLAASTADVTVAAFHWGDYKRPHHLTDHELRTAKDAIDHGADIVVGHHHHILRGIEWYKGKPIFYGLGHFVFDLPYPTSGPKELVEAPVIKAGEPDDYYGLAPREGWPWHPWHPDARYTCVAWVTVTDGKVDGAGFLPAILNPEGQVVPLDPGTPEGAEVVDYVQKGCDTQGLATRLEPGGVELAGLPTVRAVPR